MITCRHQILIKATTLGLKESSTRIPKKRRETDTAPIEADKSNGGGTSSASPDRPASAQQAPVAASASVATTPVMQPQTQPQPPPPVAATNSAAATTAANSAPTGAIPWAMPHVAASQVSSPILTSPSLGSSSANRNYYRERTTQSHLLGAKPVAGPTGPGHAPGHGYYQANGNASRGPEQ